MIDPTEMYGDKFFARRAEHYGWRAPILAQSLITLYKEFYGRDLRSVADIGCAVGDTVQGFLDAGLEGWGFEASEAARPYIVCPAENWHLMDLRKPLTGFDEFQVDLVTCFEVLEHLEPECAQTAVQNLTMLSNVLVTSACPPHPTRAPTKYHLNEQEPEYWDELFEHEGYFRAKPMERFLRAAWLPWRKKYGIAAWYQNLLVYTLGGFV